MYRNELAAAHAQNEMLRRRVAELEAGQVEPSEKLLELVRRGRAARVEQHSKRERNRQRQAIAERHAAERQKVAELRARRKRVRRACARINMNRGSWVVAMFAMFPLFIIPLLIHSSLARWVVLPIAGGMLAWPLIAYGLDRLANWGATSAERSWVEQLPYPLAGHAETLAINRDDYAVFSAKTPTIPQTAILADLVAGMAADSRGLRRWMLERTRAHTNGSDIVFKLDLRNTERDKRGRYYRIWSRAIADLLAELRAHYPVTEALVMATDD